MLNFMEYVIIGKEKPKYSYNFIDGKMNLVFRYDNAAHHREIPTFPHLKLKWLLFPGKRVDLF